MSEQKKLAVVDASCGRWYLSVAGVTVAMEGDICRAELPEEVYEPIPPEELAEATIGGKSITDIPPELVRVFRPDCWTKRMLEYAANEINAGLPTSSLQAGVIKELVEACGEALTALSVLGCARSDVANRLRSVLSKVKEQG